MKENLVCVVVTCLYNKYLITNRKPLKNKLKHSIYRQHGKGKENINRYIYSELQLFQIIRSDTVKTVAYFIKF